MEDFGFSNKYVKNFSEKYDRTAISSIERLNNDISLSRTTGFNAFNINEVFNNFKSYIDGFIEFKSKDVDGSHDKLITEKTDEFINKSLIENKRLRFDESLNFVNDYFKTLKNIDDYFNEKVNQVMLSDKLSQEFIGTLSLTFEKFLNKLESVMNNSTDELLHCSGYKIIKENKNINEDFFL